MTFIPMGLPLPVPGTVLCCTWSPSWASSQRCVGCGHSGARVGRLRPRGTGLAEALQLIFPASST